MAIVYPRRLYPVILKDEEGKDSCVVTEGSLHETDGIYLNDSAKEVLLKCNGHLSVMDMAEMLKIKYAGSSGEDVYTGVVLTLDRLQELGLIGKMAEKGKSCDIKIKKSKLCLDLVYFEVTRICNLRCVHCYNEAGQKRENEMSTEQILSIVDALGDAGVIDMVITGGEPFVRKDIFEIINAIKAKDMRFSIFTNGLLLDEKKISVLAALAPRFVAVSLDGASAPAHERIRGAGTFDRTIKAIKMLKNAGIKVRINHTLTKDSIKEIKQLSILINELNIDDVYFDRFDSLGRGKEHEDMVIPVEMGYEIKSMIDSLRPAENTGFKEYHTGINVLSASGKNMCGAGIDSCYIKANGEMSFCPVMSDIKFTTGSLLDKTLDELWYSTKWEELRNSVPEKIPECAECQGKNLCLGGCKAKAYNQYGTFNKPDPWTCNQIKGLLDHSGN